MTLLGAVAAFRNHGSIYYKNAEGKWLPVENLNAYSIIKGEGSAVKFKTVKTKAIKLEVVLPAEKTAGIYEWQVK